MKKIFFILALCFSGLSCATDENVLFFQSARQGSITQLSKNNYILSIKNSPEYVTYFSNRPVRTSGVITTQNFLSLWKNPKIKNNFIDNPPNAAVVLVSENGKRQNFIAMILNPGYIEGKLSYQISVQDKKTLTTGNLKHITLFFDNIHWNPVGF